MVAHCHTAHIFAYLLHDAGALVSEHRRRALRDGAVHGRDIRVADA